MSLKGFHHSLLKWLQTELPEKSHRQVAICCDFSEQLAKGLVAKYASELLIISDVKTSKTIPPTKQALQNTLGNSYQIVVYDARDQLDANTLFASAGFVEKSGYLILFIDHKIFDDSSDAPSDSFVKHIINTICDTTVCSLFLPSIQKIKPPVKTGIQPETQQSPSIEQQSIMHQIVGNVINQHKSVNFILGHRGRGKSTLLWQFIEHCINHKVTVVYSASHLQNCNVINQNVEKLNGLKSQYVQFLAPDALLNSNLSENIILVVDEVASIPAKTFDLLCFKFLHLVCAGTTQGYEGSANGFITRRLKHIQNKYLYHLEQPFRWYLDDPIELTIKEIFSPAYQPFTEVNPIATERLEFVSLSKEELTANACLYKDSIGLLLDAHYRTTPTNIQRIIDTKEQIFLAVKLKSRVIALAVLVKEMASGNTKLNNDVAIGIRRPKGNLFQQNLALHLLDPLVMAYSFLRVHRLAVAPNFQRKGIGSALLSQVLNSIISKNTILCTSFGLNEQLHQFWQKNQFKLVKIGRKIDSASGTVSGFYVHKSDYDKHQFLYDADDKLWADVQFIARHDKQLIGYIPDKIIDTKKAPIVYEKLTARLTFFADSLVSFEKISSDLYVFSIIEKNEELDKLIEERVKKGLSKSSKQNIDAAIKNILKSI